MASKLEIKVDTDTMNKINALIKEKNISPDRISDTIGSAINKLWEMVYTKQTMLRVEKVDISVTPKSSYKKEVSLILGKKKTYTAIKIYKSWLGISDGLYKFKGSDNLFPSSWFVVTTKKNKKFIKPSVAGVATIVLLLLA